MNFSHRSIAAMWRPEELGLPEPKRMTRRPAKEHEYCRCLARPNLARVNCTLSQAKLRYISAQDLLYFILLDIYSVRNQDSGCKSVYDRLKWEVGRDYAIQPGRGQKQVGRFTLASIGWEPDVRQMPPEDVAREGFPSLETFLDAWARFYGPDFFGPPLGDWVLGMSDVVIDEAKLPPEVWRVLEETGRQ